jgi:hypothetical protein
MNLKTPNILTHIAKILLFACASFILLWSCYYDSEEYLFPRINTQCDTTKVTYSGSIQPILSLSCYNCHDVKNYKNYGENIRLDTYEDVKLRMDDGRLMKSIRHEGDFPMPMGTLKLTDCQIRTFEIWQTDTIPNN